MAAGAWLCGFEILLGARRSDVRFFVTLLVLSFVTAFVILAAWHEVQTLFGV